MKKLITILMITVIMTACKKDELCERVTDWVNIEIGVEHNACNQCEVTFRNNCKPDNVKFYINGVVVFQHQDMMKDVKVFKVEKDHSYKLECCKQGMFKKRDI